MLQMVCNFIKHKQHYAPSRNNRHRNTFSFCWLFNTLRIEDNLLRLVFVRVIKNGVQRKFERVFG